MRFSSRHPKLEFFSENYELFLSVTPNHSEEMPLTVFIMFVAAKIAAEIFERLRQPAVVGEILAGVIIGGSVPGWVAPSEFTNLIAEIGIVFLLFTVGLETKPSAILKVGKVAVLVAVSGIVIPFIGGYFLMLAWGGSNLHAIFIGSVVVATTLIAPPLLKILFASEEVAKSEFDPDDAGGILAQGDFCRIG